MQLYTYYRSSASYRVRIALNLKELEAEMIPVNLLKSEQSAPEHVKRNPQGLVPVLADGGHLLTQSLAIIEYLEETHPQPALLPETPHERARVRALAQAIACEVAPLNNLRVLRYLTGTLGASEAQKDAWYAHWIAEGFSALESLLAQGPHTGVYCHGDAPGLADCCLVPQVYNARRFNCPLEDFPTILRIDAACAQHPAFIAAHPEKQKDASVA